MVGQSLGIPGCRHHRAARWGSYRPCRGQQEQDRHGNQRAGPPAVTQTVTQTKTVVQPKVEVHTNTVTATTSTPSPAQAESEARARETEKKLRTVEKEDEELKRQLEREGRPVP
jgi:hypothetical protein